MSLADKMQADGAVFVNPYHFGELLIYLPWNVVHGTATASVAAGLVTTIAVVAPGGGYQDPPPVLLTGGGGKGAKAAATIDPATGRLSAINVTAAGEGYTSAPTVVVGGCYGVVRREPPGRFGDLTAKTPRLKCTLRNSATDGVVKVNTGKDSIVTPAREGRAAETLTVAGIISQTKSIWKLRLK